MNFALNSKWGWKFVCQDESGIWKDIVRAKYKRRSFYNISPFWKDTLDTFKILRLGFSVNIGDGHHTNFWHDRWTREGSLSSLFPILFAKCKKDNVTVAQVRHNGRLNLALNGGTTAALRQEMRELFNLINSYPLSSNKDEFRWEWGNNRTFTVHDVYEFLNFGGIKLNMDESVWSLKIPHKVQLFIWLTKHNKILTKDNLIKKGWVGSQQCSFCQMSEDVDHLFFKSPYVVTFWQAFNCSRTNPVPHDCFSDFWIFTQWLPLLDRLYCRHILAALCWSIWLERNKAVFNGSYRTNYSVFISALSNFQFWTNSAASFSYFFRSSVVVPDNGNAGRVTVTNGSSIPVNTGAGAAGRGSGNAGRSSGAGAGESGAAGRGSGITGRGSGAGAGESGAAGRGSGMTYGAAGRDSGTEVQQLDVGAAADTAGGNSEHSSQEDLLDL